MINIYSPDKQELRQVNVKYSGCIGDPYVRKRHMILGRLIEPDTRVRPYKNVLDEYDLPDDKLEETRKLVEGQEVTLIVGPPRHIPKRHSRYPDGVLETVFEIKPFTKF